MPGEEPDVSFAEFTDQILPHRVNARWQVQMQQGSALTRGDGERIGVRKEFAAISQVFPPE